MQELDLAIQTSPLAFLSPTAFRKVHTNLPLVEIALARNEGKHTSPGALMADTGKFTGRSPKDRYIVHDFTIICAPEFEANPETDGTKNPNFAILNLSERIILIGGTGYAGEIKNIHEIGLHKLG